MGALPLERSGQWESGNYLSVPDVHTLVKGAAGQVLPVGAKSYTIDWFLVFGERVDANTPLHVPQSNCRIERSTGKTGEKTSPQHTRVPDCFPKTRHGQRALLSLPGSYVSRDNKRVHSSSSKP